MGHGTFDRKSYDSFSRSTVGRSTAELYGSRGMHESLNPYGVKVRESRDSEDSPEATPIIIGLDVTGSMGMLADVIAREGLGVLINNILDRKPITDPHVMFMAIGDANYDTAPLQVSQFEADNRIVEQLTQIYIEHGGGGNKFESYNLSWYFAAFHTVHDSIEKRGKRGYLFTVGDEEAPGDLTASQLKQFIGVDVQSESLSTEMLLKLAQRSYDVFHVVIEQGDYAQRRLDSVMSSWTALMGQRVIRLADYKLLAETIVSAIEIAEGRDALSSASGWGDGKGEIVHNAVKELSKGTGHGALLPPAAT